jgi:pyruvate/2-oxoglutarate dehydrogenase complex dihydrolipoamide dehydrogenase (E3) component
MEPERSYEMVLGTGQAGKPLALVLGGASRRNVVVEREYVGGTCLNVGCTPTKTMVACACVAYLTRRAAEYGVHRGPEAVEMTQVRRRKQTIVDDFRGGAASARDPAFTHISYHDCRGGIEDPFHVHGGVKLDAWKWPSPRRFKDHGRDPSSAHRMG